MPQQLFNNLIAAQTSDVAESTGRILGLDAEFLLEIGIMMINVLFLSAVLFFVLYKPVKKFLNKRTERVENDINSAAEELKNAEVLKEKYQGMLANIDNEREEILTKAHKTATKKSDQIIAEAKQQAEIVYNKNMAKLEAEKIKANKEIWDQVVEISTMMAKKFVEISIDKETQDKYIEQAFADWKEKSTV